MPLRRRAVLASLPSISAGGDAASAADGPVRFISAVSGRDRRGTPMTDLHLFRHGGALDDPGLRDHTRDRERDSAGGPRIRCPKCAWEPRREDTWACACLHEWNTFETGGVCPACQRQWLETQCPRCDAWSPHLAWYVDEGGAGPT